MRITVRTIDRDDPMNTRHVFLAAFWAGLSGPAMLYSTPQPLYQGLQGLTVADSFASVGLNLVQVAAWYDDEQSSAASQERAAPTANIR
jgi:hypothetical protein